MVIKKNVLLVLIITISFFLFFPLFFTYFSQDDFFIFSITHVKNISDFFHFFIPRQDVQFYRPIGVEIFFFICRKLFGWNPLPYHLLLWGIFAFSIILVYKIGKQILNSFRSALIIALLYGTSAIHYNSLSWLSNSSYIIETFLFFLSFYLFIYIKPSLVRIYILSFLYLLALLTHEFGIVLPCVLFSFVRFHIGNNTFKTEKKFFILSGIITLAYIILRFIYPSDVGSYPLSFNQSIISSYRFFVLYFLNWPEAIKDNFLKYWMIRPEFLKKFHAETISWILNTASIFVIFLIPLFVLIKKQMILKRACRKSLFYIFWFLICLFPIVIIPSHIAPHYGSISLLPFLILVLFPVLKASRKSLNYQIFLMFAGLTWVYSAAVTIKFDQDNHWIKRRADMAKYWIGEADKRRDIIQYSNKIVINKDEKEIKVALFEEKAFQEYFNNLKIRVLYQKESNAYATYSSVLLE